MENTELFWAIMGAIGAQTALVVVFLIYLLKMLDAADKRAAEISGKLENAIGRLSIIQDIRLSHLGENRTKCRLKGANAWPTRQVLAKMRQDLACSTNKTVIERAFSVDHLLSATDC